MIDDLDWTSSWIAVLGGKRSLTRRDQGERKEEVDGWMNEWWMDGWIVTL